MRNKFILGWAISSLQALSSLALLATSAWLLSRADQRPSIMYLSIAVVGVRAFALGKAFFRYGERLLLHDATFRKATARRTGIYKSLVNRAPIGLAESRVGALLANLVDDTEESLNLDLRYRPALIQSVAVTVAGIILYFYLAPSSAWLVVMVLIFGATATYLGSRFANGKVLAELSQLRSELASASESIVARNRVLRAYGWQNREIGNLDTLTDKVTQVELKLARINGWLQSFIILATYSTILAAVSGSLAAGESLPGEQVAILVLLPLGIFEYLQAIPAALLSRSKATVSLSRLVDLENAAIPNEIDTTEGETLERFETLRVAKVVATYPDGTSVPLPDFTLNAGDSLSITGKSGSGKSTVANILVGFLRQSSGDFVINGKPIGEFDGRSLRQVIGLVEQQPIVLAGTIKSNLLLAAPDATDQQLIQTLTEVDLWEMLKTRSGLETEVGLQGSKLSGGEAQRLALARNLLANRQLIILDEPTSSVDSSAALSLVSALLKVAKARGITVLLITHDTKLTKLTERLVKF